MCDCVISALGEEARKNLREVQQKLTQAEVNLGRQYSELVTGQSHTDMHHSCQGRYVPGNNSKIIIPKKIPFLIQSQGIKKPQRSTSI